MPSADSPKVTMEKQKLPPAFFESKTEKPAFWGWLCPGDHTVAAYLDGIMGNKKAKFESHLAKCAHCRSTVADVIKAQRNADEVAPPLEIVQKAVRSIPVSAPRRGSVWIPAGAVAVTAIVIAVVLMREPQTMPISSPAAPNAPLIAKSGPTRPEAAQEWIRGAAPAELLPSILFPRPQSVVPRAQLKFDWKPLPNVRSYEVQVVTAEGDVVWERQTDQHTLPMPLGMAISDGSYFVWVTADFGDGRLTRSAPVAFRVKR